jgi:hypothetical protein
MRYICSLAFLLLFVAGCTGYNIVPLDDDDTPVDNPDDPPEDPPGWTPTVTFVDDFGDDDATPEPPEIPDPRFYILTKSGFRGPDESNLEQIDEDGNVLDTIGVGFPSSTITAMPGEYSFMVMNNDLSPGVARERPLNTIDGLLDTVTETGLTINGNGKIHFARNANLLVGAVEAYVYFRDLDAGTAWVRMGSSDSQCWVDATSSPIPGDNRIFLLEQSERAIHIYNPLTEEIMDAPYVSGLPDSTVLGMDEEGNFYTGSDSPVISIVPAVDRMPIFLSIPEIHRTIALEPAGSNSIWLLYIKNEESKAGTVLERIWSDGTREAIFDVVDAPWSDFIVM